MADLRIVDAPLLSTVKGTEKLPTGGEGNFSVSIDQVADFSKLKWSLATEGYVDNAVNGVRSELVVHTGDIDNPHQVTKDQVGLGNVDNTADVDKPIGSATQAALATLTQNKAEKTYVDTQLNNKADKATTYSKTESDTLLANKSDATYVNTKYSSHIKTFLNTGTAISNTLNGEYFFIISSDSEKVEDLYLNVNGVATNQNKSELSSLLQHNSILGRDAIGAHQATSIGTSSGVTQQDINDFGGAKWYAKAGGYDLGATVKLANGNIVKSTEPNNTNNPNVNMTGWVKENSIRTVESISDMLAVSNPKNGDVYTVLHFDKPSGRLKGGGTFIYDSTKSAENDGGVCLNGWVRQLENNVLNPFMFGAYGDFIPKAQEVIERQSGHNDAVAFQKMYNMNKYTVFTNISKLPPVNKAEYTFEWANQMFYIEDTLPIRSYQFTDCKGGKIFFNPVGSKHLFTTPRQEMIDAYAQNTGWNTQTICYATFKDGVIIGNVTRTSTVHADKCFDLGNPYKCILDNMLIERFKCGVDLYPIDTSAWTNGERIGNFYENELRNVTVHECMTGVINSANATHATNLTIGGGYIVGKDYTNKFNYLLINGGAGFSCTGFNIAPAHRQNLPNALIYDGCVGSSYTGGYTEWFDTLFDLGLQRRFGGFNFQGCHIFKESTDIVANFKNSFSSFDYSTWVRNYLPALSNNQY